MSSETVPATSPPRRSLLTEGILLTLCTAAMYALAFQYEAGYADCYGYPHWLIDIGLGNVILAWTSMSVGLLVVLMLYFLIGLFLPVRVLRVVVFSRASVMLIGPPLLCAALPISDSDPLWVQVTLFSLAAVSWILSVPLWVSAFRKTNPSGALLLRIGEANEGLFPAVRDSPSPRTADSLIMRTMTAPGVGSVYVLSSAFLIFTTLLIAFANSYGRYRAGQQDNYLVSSDRPALVVLRRYGDKWIVTPSNLPNSSAGSRPIQVIASDKGERVWTFRMPPAATMRRLACR